MKMTPVEQAQRYLKRMLDGIKASPKAATVTAGVRAAGIVTALNKLVAKQIEFVDQALALLTITSLRIPGELRMEALEDGDGRTFSLFRDTTHVGSFMVDCYDENSGLIGNGIRVMIPESAYLNEKATKH